MATTEYVLKRGASGAVISVTLRDANGVFDLTGFSSVKMTARKGTQTPVLDEVTMSIGSPATAGVVTYAFTPTTSDIFPGTYDLEFVGTDASGDKHYFPTNKRTPYGKLIVQRNLVD